MAEINVSGASALYMKVDITNVRQNVAGNSSTVKFVASMRQTSGKNFNQVPGVDFKVVVNGTTLANKTGFFLDVRGNVTQVFHTADVVIPHNTDGTKSFSWSFWFDPKGMWSTYKPTTLSGTQALPRIARVSNSTLSANAFDFGESFTVYTNQTDPSFTHTISYIRGSTVTSLATGVKTSKAVSIPSDQMSNYKTATTASMKIRTSTYSGSTLVGDYDLDVTVRVPTTAVPTIGAVSLSAGNAVFTSENQYIASKDRVKATVANVKESYSSPIQKYLYRVQQRTTFSMEGTSNGATFPTFNFPATGSEVVNIQMAVVDARGRQSAWSTSSAIRVHAYQPPSIGATVITRNANVTTVNVRRNWSVTELFQGGVTTTPRNTGTLVINYREAGTSTWKSTNGGASGLSGVNSNVALTGFSGATSYEFQIKLTDKFQTTTAPIIKIGTEFVPMDIGPKGVGVGKIHSDGTADLEVGSGGIISEGLITSKNSGQTLTLGSRNASYAHYETTSPSHYFNKKLQVAGDVLAGTGYNRKLAYQDEVHASFGNSTLSTTAHMDNMVTPGVYQYSGSVFSSIDTYGVLVARVAGGVATHNGTNTWLYQTAYATAGNIYQRNRINAGAWSAWVRMPRLTDVPTATYGVYTGSLRGVMNVGSGRILHGVATAKGNSTSTFNSLGNTLTFPAAFSTNTDYPVTVTYSITSNVTALENRMITVNIRNVSRTGFTWDARDSASGTSPSGGTVYTLHWTAMGVR